VNASAAPVAASVLVHGVALVAIAAARGAPDRGTPDAAHRSAAGPDIVSVEILPPPPLSPLPSTPLEVAIVDDESRDAARIPTPTPTLPRTGAALVRGRSGRTGAPTGVATPESRSSGGSTGSGAPDSGDATPPRTGALAMRGLRHDLTLRSEAMARVLEGGHPLAPPVAKTGRIDPHGREGEIDDAVAVYHVHADGTVDVTNLPDIDIHAQLLPTPEGLRQVVHAIGDDLTAWRDDPYRDTRVGKVQDLPEHLQAIPGQCSKAGDPMCDADPPHTIGKVVSGAFILPSISGRLDLTSYLMRKFVGDPYTPRKLKLLDDTRAERVASGAAFRTGELGRSAELMAHNLDALSRTEMEPEALRRALFELWDECAEGDDPAGAAGQRARAMVLGWIGAHLTPGQPGAFSPDDIAALDAHRASHQHFAPY
jgi:hypothetical protein